MQKNFILALAVLSFSCTSTKDIQKKITEFHTEFTPIDPVEYGWTIPYLKADGTEGSKITLSATEAEKMAILKNQGTLVSIVENTVNGDISYGPAKVSSKNSYYRIVMDYAKYKNAYTKYGEAKVGIGLRIVAKVRTTSNNVNLGDLFALGLAAEANHLSGTMSVDVIGMDSKDITNILPFQSEINKTTIQNVMQALASIKAKIHDTNTTICPHILSIKPLITLDTNGQITVAELNKQINTNRDLIISELTYKPK